ncbi:MAG: hypoxanthine phosphoribosyltransferase [Desulfohalobiaceae bacterium]|nr:hypoxanthine phosphoribosyltransferase [Desulfohalobiaceae bacterium]
MHRLELIFTPEQVRDQVARVGGEISRSYGTVSESVVLVCVLKGAFVFFADLIRQLDFHTEIEFVRLASYGSGTAPSQEISFSQDVETSLRGKHVLIVEDIVDTGHTVDYLGRQFQARGTASLGVCSLIHKLERHEAGFVPDFTCFTVNSGFLVGCGLDYAESYRGLSGIHEVHFTQQPER